jgi:hypothetical protein
MLEGMEPASELERELLEVLLGRLRQWTEAFPRTAQLVTSQRSHWEGRTGLPCPISILRIR